MPHSVSSNDSVPRDAEDEVLPDAPPEEAADAPTKEDKADEENDNTKPGVNLENLFDDDDDDDDEFPASSAADGNMESSPLPVPAAYVPQA
jgi:DNA primase small subunit